MKIAVICFLLVAARFTSSLPLAAENASDQTVAAPEILQPSAAPAVASAAATADGLNTDTGAQAPLQAQPNSLPAGGLESMGLSSDNGASVASADGITMDKLYAGIDMENLVKPYGKPEDQNMDLPPVELPPVEEVREGDNRNFLQIYPEINKQQEVVSNKLINTFSVQNKKITVTNKNTVSYLKTLNVNTNYVTNVQRVNHPKQQIQTLSIIQNRYVPKLIVKHTRTDRINELPPKEVVAPPVVQESTSQLPPIVEKVEIEREDYDPNAPKSTGAAAAGLDQQASASAAAADQQPQSERAVAASDASQQQSAAPAADAAQQTQVAAAAADEPTLARARKALQQLITKS